MTEDMHKLILGEVTCRNLPGHFLHMNRKAYSYGIPSL